MYHFTGVRGSPGVALMAIGRAAENCDELAPPCMSGKEHCEG